MKFTADQKTLSAALKRAARIATVKTIPILETARIEVTETGIEIIATDMDLWLRLRVEGDLSGEGVCCPPIGRLANFVSALPADRKVELAAEGNAFAVYCGPSRASFPLLKTEDFPQIKEPPRAEAFPAAGLSGLVEFALPFVSTETTRHYLMGVYLHRTKTGIAVCATDGTALAVSQLEGQFPAFPSIIVPPLCASAIAGNEDDFTLSIDETRVCVTSQRETVISRLIDGTFPEYERVVAPLTDNPVTFAAPDMVAALNQLSAAVEAEGVMGHRGIKLAISEGSIVLSAGDSIGSTAVSEIKALYRGEPAEIGFSGRYLKRIVEAIGKDEIALHFRDPSSPARLCNPGETFDHITILPYRV